VLAVGTPADGYVHRGVNGTPTTSISASGAAFVFVYDGASWTQTSYIKASNADVSDDFGVAVAIDGENLAVGAPRERGSSRGIGVTPAVEDDTSPINGAVYVYRLAR
jgi:FG-GAP repeat protein